MEQVKFNEGQSLDIISENIEKLKGLFPEACSEGGINFETLRQLLGDESVLDEGEEKYGLNWHGKKKARQIALTPSTGTLLPCPAESVEWEKTQNLFIEGDNLEVLKLLQKAYANKVKMIYIDPPYNTGGEFIYPDRFQENLDTYLKYTGQIDDDGQKFSSNTESSGRKHTNWLNMMLPRLKIARGLLKEDGCIFISIDDNEQASLRKLCDEIFGEENFISNIVWQKKYARQNDSKTLSNSHDHILLYAKNIEFWKAGKIPKTEDQLKGYKNPDNDPKGLWQSVVYTCNKTRSERPNLYYPITNPFTGIDVYPDESRVWAYEEQRTLRNIEEGRLWWGKDGGLEKPRMKSYLEEVGAGVVPDTLWLRSEVGDTQDSAREISKIFGAPVFDTPKPVKLLKHCMKVANCCDNDLVVDFFAGSSTLGHAVYSINADDSSNVRFIAVQLPERLDEKKPTQNVAYKFCLKNSLKANIAEISKERLRRVGGGFKESNVDSGFKVFKLSESNIRSWTPDHSDLEESLLSHEEHLIKGRTEEDVLYELLLKRGVDLAVPIETREVSGKSVYSIGYGVLFACLDGAISREQVEGIAQGILVWHAELCPSSETHVFFRDSAFADDVSKTNMAAILEQNGISHVRSL
jgi:adenine-specific DNA-methyltransferase